MSGAAANLARQWDIDNTPRGMLALEEVIAMGCGKFAPDWSPRV
jgi:hypothetical protein